MKEETLESKLVFDGKFIKVRIDKVKLPNGTISEREVVERRDGVSVLALTEDNNFILIKQYRHAQNKVIWRIPGGGIDDYDPSPEEAAQRELFEETGYKSNNLELLFKSGGSGTIKGDVYHYLATKLYIPNLKRNLDPEEFIEIHKVDIKDSYDMAIKAQFPNPAFSLMIIMAYEKIKNI